MPARIVREVTSTQTRDGDSEDTQTKQPLSGKRADENITVASSQSSEKASDAASADLQETHFNKLFWYVLKGLEEKEGKRGPCLTNRIQSVVL